ncbi:hypothetical protein XMA152_000023 [Marinobacterium sp. xm-a-152]|nr:hypothetical protein [Marinobacterium sp. xm-a-152]
MEGNSMPVRPKPIEAFSYLIPCEQFNGIHQQSN